MSENRPNFIFIITDQQRADYLGCYGHPVLKTPNIDRLGHSGTIFENFFVASPICMPNRSSLMTGRMPSLHGVRMNGIPLSTHNVTFVELLRAAGYATGLIGKSHLQNFTSLGPVLPESKTPADFHQAHGDLHEAWRERLTSAVYQQESPDFWRSTKSGVEPPFYGFDHVELVTGHGDAVGGDYVNWLRQRRPDAGSLQGPENQLPHDYVCPQAVRTAVPEELYPSNYIAERAGEFLAGQKTGDAPYFLMISFPDPHHPFNPPGRYWDMYAPEDMAVPEAFARNDWVPPPHVQATLDVRAQGNVDLNSQYAFSVGPREAQEAQALTCGMISCLDDAIGRILETAERSGNGRETVIAFTSDHGDHLGDHRLLLKGPEQYRQILQVPFIWYDPGTGPTGRSGALASTIDIPATLLERARVAPFVGMQGRSLLPVIADPTRPHRDAVFIQYDHQVPNDGLGVPPRVHTVYDGRWRLSLFDGVGWGELYDLADDPGEFHNRWDDPDCSGEKARMLERLANLEIEHIDRSPNPTGRA